MSLHDRWRRPGVRRRFLLGAAGAVVLAAAGFAYANWIVIRTPDPHQLSELVVDRPPPGFAPTPVQRGPVERSEMVFAEVKTASQRTPGNAGQFASSWKGNSDHKGSTAELVLTLLPSDAGAKTVRAAASAKYLDPKKLAAANYRVVGHFTVPGVPGSEGVSLTSTTTQASTAIVVYRYERAVVLEFVTGSGSSRAAATLGQRQAQLLQAMLPGFSTIVTTFPVVASVVYWGTIGAVLVAAVLAPVVVRRARRRSARRRQDAERRERLSRGRKVVKRRGPVVGTRSHNRR